MSAVDTLLAAAIGVLLFGELALHILGGWQLAIAALGLGRPRRVAPGGERTRFLVVVPAHDEESVIERTVASLLALDYPASRRTVVVLADRCTDATAARARAAGAEVLERASVGADAPGKTGAIAWVLDTLAPRRAEWDALVLIDADNRVAPDLLRRFSGHLEAGERVVQAFTGTLGADVSRTSRWSALGFLVINHLGQEPRERLRLSAAVGGTGVAIDLGVLDEVRWDMRSLTEDLELGAKLALARIRVAFDPVRIHDEKPARLRHSVSQRTRWMQGRFDVVGRFFVPLLRRAAEKGDVRALDVALSLVSPGLGFCGVAAGLAALFRLAVLVAGPHLGQGHAARIAGLVPPGAALVAALAYWGSTFLALRAERLPARYYGALLTSPLFLLLSFPLAVVGFLRRRERVWVRTPHGGGGSHDAPDVR